MRSPAGREAECRVHLELGRKYCRKRRQDRFSRPTIDPSQFLNEALFIYRPNLVQYYLSRLAFEST
jgi:hypothetical protein